MGEGYQDGFKICDHRCPTRCNQSEPVYVSEKIFFVMSLSCKGLETAGCQLVVFWLLSYKVEHQFAIKLPSCSSCITICGGISISNLCSYELIYVNFCVCWRWQIRDFHQSGTVNYTIITNRLHVIANLTRLQHKLKGDRSILLQFYRDQKSLWRLTASGWRPPSLKQPCQRQQDYSFCNFGHAASPTTASPSVSVALMSYGVEGLFKKIN